MSDSLVQLRIDERLKSEATDIYEKLGLDLPTAIRIFLTRSVEEQGIPFSMKLKDHGYKAEDAIKAMRKMSRTAQECGTANMTLDEINAEIDASRRETEI